MTHYVLDACALVALLKGENGAEAVDHLFQQAVQSNAALFMSIVNLLEVYYGFVSDIGLTETRNMMNIIQYTPLVIIDTISQQVYHEAARLKGTYHRLSLADAVGVATAIELSGVFVTADHHELEVIENKETTLNFFWFR
jgi:PIN domain nuclease of toxin-antitoxin system